MQQSAGDCFIELPQDSQMPQAFSGMSGDSKSELSRRITISNFLVAN